MDDKKTILKMKNIHKYFGRVHALRGVDFDLREGEIHALVGTHRAGKSSLVKMLSGASCPDDGEIYLNKKKVSSLDPNEAIQNGIGIIYQEPVIFPVLSTIDSIFIGQLLQKGFKKKNEKAMLKEAVDVCEKYNLDIHFKRFIDHNTQNEQNLVEVLKVLMHDPKIMILDEISTRFTPGEMEKIYPIIFDLKERGMSIIYISHNMDEIMRLADRVTILNEGRRMGTESIKSLDKMRLIRLAYSFTMSRQELEEQNLQLFYLKKYNEDILKNIPIGVVILNDDNRVYLTNEIALNILNLDGGDYTDQLFFQVLKRKSFDEKTLLLKKINEKLFYDFEKIFFEDNKVLKIIVIPFKNDESEFIGTIILIEDITKDYNFINYLRRADKISSIAELASGVAHEINNPLGIVKNYIELLMGTQLDDNQASKLTNMENEIIRIAEIVKSLLTFSKQSKLTFKTINLFDVIDDVIILLEHKIKVEGITVQLKKNVSNALCSGDEVRLKQLIMNLIMNSIEAINEDGIIVVDLYEDELKEFWIISVEDNGCGIPANKISDIFDPFFTTKEEMKNSGLGLSICHNVVELHHGRILCESELNKHTIFKIFLPKLTNYGL